MTWDDVMRKARTYVFMQEVASRSHIDPARVRTLAEAYCHAIRQGELVRYLADNGRRDLAERAELAFFQYLYVHFYGSRFVEDAYWDGYNPAWREA